MFMVLHSGTGVTCNPHPCPLEIETTCCPPSLEVTVTTGRGPATELADGAVSLALSSLVQISSPMVANMSLSSALLAVSLTRAASLTVSSYPILDDLTEAETLWA